MALELDTRQRAMLQEMGVQVWLPESGVITLTQSPSPAGPVASQPDARGAERSAPCPPAAARPPPLPAQNALPPALSDSERPQSGAPADHRHLDWPALAETVRSCQACGLCNARSKASIAPLTDTLHCDWMLIGDPPDEDEDHSGAPFSGQDGVLLDNMLRALRLQRANPVAGAAPVTATESAQRAYVSHVLKCRPAHGAIPKPAELAQCAAYLQREIALVQPKMILAMGRFANQVLLGDTPALATLPLGKLRGSVHRYQGVPVVVTYHPKVLMRNGADKAKAWADLCLAASSLEG